MCEGGIQANAGHHHTDAIGPDDPQQVRLGSGEHLLLQGEPLLSQFREPSRDHDSGLGPARAKLVDQSRHLIGRCGDDGQIGCLGQTRHVRMDEQPIEAGMGRIDQKKLPLEAAAPQVRKGYGTDRAGTRRGSDQSN